MTGWLAELWRVWWTVMDLRHQRVDCPLCGSPVGNRISEHIAFDHTTAELAAYAEAQNREKT